MTNRLQMALFATASCFALTATTAIANDKLNELSKSNENWIMPGKNYSSQNYSPNDKINAENVKSLKRCLVVLDRPASWA